MAATNAPAGAGIIPAIVALHAEEAVLVHTQRTSLIRAPHITLRDLGRFDERLRAHLDGLAVAGEAAWAFCESGLLEPSVGAMFTAAVRALEERDEERVDRLLALAATDASLLEGFASGLGWVSGNLLRGVVARLLGSPEPLRRAVGITACIMHKVDPGLVSGQRLQDPEPAVRARALQGAGELGVGALVSACAAAVGDDDPECQLWAAWSALLLGDRNRGLERLMLTGLEPGLHRERAFRLALQAMSLDAAHGVLKQLATDPQQIRWLIQGSGIAGDPVYVPWLIKQMTDPARARLAGEAFSLVTGVDLGAVGLDTPRPAGLEPGPNDDPDDANVDMDPDDGLPWPDPAKIQGWWSANASRFQPGSRYFVGAPVTRAHCIEVLKNGYQRQRILAAHHLCLLAPGTPLFNTSAPAWRQQRLLAAMT